jgi:hypothetical protein
MNSPPCAPGTPAFQAALAWMSEHFGTPDARFEDPVWDGAKLAAAMWGIGGSDGRSLLSEPNVVLADRPVQGRVLLFGVYSIRGHVVPSIYRDGHNHVVTAEDRRIEVVSGEGGVTFVAREADYSTTPLSTDAVLAALDEVLCAASAHRARTAIARAGCCAQVQVRCKAFDVAPRMTARRNKFS